MFSLILQEKMIPFSPPRIDDEIVNEVVAALKSGWITTGPRVRMLEAMLAEYSSVEKVLCLNSATAGLELVLRWFGVGPGDEVIVPAYTYAASANVIIHCGAKPVFADVNPQDFNIDVTLLPGLINASTKVIIPVDIAGFPADYDSINQLVSKPTIKNLFSPNSEEQATLGRILVLSDAAHSVGATYHGKKTGSHADVTVFSFHAVKNLTTAEGGAVCLNLPSPFDNESVYKILTIKGLHGQNKDALAKMQVGNWRYDIVEAGYKMNMTDIQAAIGIVELRRYDSDMLKRRKEIFHKYSVAFSSLPWAEIPIVADEKRETSYHVYQLRIKGIDEATRDAVISRIFAKNVSVNVHFIPLPMMTFYKSLGYNIKDFPVSYRNYSREISLPVYYDLSDEDVQKVVEAVIVAVNTELDGKATV